MPGRSSRSVRRMGLLVLAALALTGSGCERRPGAPKPPSDPTRPPTPTTLVSTAPAAA